MESIYTAGFCNHLYPSQTFLGTVRKADREGVVLKLR